MLIKQILENLEVNEGVNDPNIFKAVFMAGGPGSGKSYVANKMFKGTGMRMVNSDDIYEYLMQVKHELPMDSKTIYSPKGQEIRGDAKEITKRKEQLHTDGRLGMVIDGTGKDVAKIAKAKAGLEAIGYESIMVFVNTSLEVAQERNLQRPRSLEPEEVEKMWRKVQNNIQAFQRLFGHDKFIVVDSTDSTKSDENINHALKPMRQFLNSEPSRPKAKAWIQAVQDYNRRDI